MNITTLSSRISVVGVANLNERHDSLPSPGLGGWGDLQIPPQIPPQVPPQIPPPPPCKRRLLFSHTFSDRSADAPVSFVFPPLLPPQQQDEVKDDSSIALYHFDDHDSNTTTTSESTMLFLDPEPLRLDSPAPESQMKKSIRISNMFMDHVNSSGVPETTIMSPGQYRCVGRKAKMNPIGNSRPAAFSLPQHRLFWFHLPFEGILTMDVGLLYSFELQSFLLFPFFSWLRIARFFERTMFPEYPPKRHIGFKDIAVNSFSYGKDKVLLHVASEHTIGVLGHASAGMTLYSWQKMESILAPCPLLLEWRRRFELTLQQFLTHLPLLVVDPDLPFFPHPVGTLLSPRCEYYLPSFSFKRNRDWIPHKYTRKQAEFVQVTIPSLCTSARNHRPRVTMLDSMSISSSLLFNDLEEEEIPSCHSHLASEWENVQIPPLSILASFKNLNESPLGVSSASSSSSSISEPPLLSSPCYWGDL